jgi:hypothetical protein
MTDARSSGGRASISITKRRESREMWGKEIRGVQVELMRWDSSERSREASGSRRAEETESWGRREGGRKRESSAQFFESTRVQLVSPRRKRTTKILTKDEGRVQTPR